jgi:DNA end-binding protein Ku
MVNIPVKLYAATESREVGFHQVHLTDGGRIRLKRVCTADGAEVAHTDLASGLELPDGRMIVLTEQDLANLPLPTARSIEVLQFCAPDQLDPLILNTPYYLAPADQAAGRAYVLLREAMRTAGRVAVAKLALRRREHLAAIEVRGDYLLLETLRWPDEIRHPSFDHIQGMVVRPEELDMAKRLIDALTSTFNPADHTDAYRAAVLELVEAKAKGQLPALPAPQPAGSDLVSALAASLAATVPHPQSTSPTSQTV